MTTSPIGTVTPQVELRFHPTDLDPSLLHEATRRLGSPSEAIEAALLMARISVMTIAKEEVAKLTGEMSRAKLVGIADFAWQLYAPKFVRALGPVFADQYLRTMKAAGAGEIPMSTVYALAEQHASRVGTYYHESSRDALLAGFDTFVNRRLTEKVAADRVLDAYGLTARGMNGYTSRTLDKAATVTPMNLRQRALDYIGTSIRRRSKVFATQEAHNLDQQAEQIAWMWLQSKGELTAAAEKVWMTARDERVCTQCGPMHNVRVPLTDRFTLPNGTQLYVPGAHPNCRCRARLLDHPYKQEMSKALLGGRVSKAEWNPKLHPRGGDPENPGRFSVRAREAAKPRVAEKEAEDLTRLQSFLDQAAATAEVSAEDQELLSFLDQATAPKAHLEIGEERAHLASSQRAHLEPTARAHLRPTETQGEEKAHLAIGSETGGRAELGAMPSARAQLRLKMTPEQRLWLDTEAERIALAHDEKARRIPQSPEPTPGYRRPTKLVQDENGKPTQVYFVIDRSAIDPDGYIDLDGEEEFIAGDLKHMLGQAHQDFYEEMNQAAEFMMDNEGNFIDQTFGDGRRFRGTIDEDGVYDVVDWAAHHGKAHQPPDKQVHVTWREVDMDDQPLEDGEEFSDWVPLSAIADMWGMTPDQFEKVVLVLREGHDSKRGTTERLGTKARYGVETWRATGRFKVSELGRSVTGGREPAAVADLEPDAPTEEFQHPGTYRPDGP